MSSSWFGLIVMTVTVLPVLGAAAQATGANGASSTTYVAHLHPMNSSVTGQQATGEARFVVNDNTLTITVDMSGVPPGMMHWQHFHGFKDNRDATCPTSAADVNHDDPAAMQVASNTYPTASANDTYQYQVKVSLSALQTAFTKAFGDRNLDLDRRVVFIHGVPAGTKLPASVASLGTIPAQVTLPIACGKIERVWRG